jgi:very-short-patch-repair endonuclease
MNKAYIDYNLNLKSNSKLLRNNSTLSEVLLWQKLRAGSMLGFKFNRQKPLGKYIVDFYCKNLNLVIEIDGSSHDDKYEEDLIRQKNWKKLVSILYDLQIYK